MMLLARRQAAQESIDEAAKVEQVCRASRRVNDCLGGMRLR